MHVLKKSLFPIVLSSIVLFSSFAPVAAMNAASKSASALRPGSHSPSSSQAGQEGQAQSVEAEPVRINIKKRKLSFKQKLRKKVREIKKEVSEFVGEHPIATVASVIGSAIALWFLWDKLSNPWIHRNQAVGNSACDIIEAAVQPGDARQLQFGGQLPDARFQLHNPAQIVQLRCANQVGPECAYHALKNCMVILNQLAHPQDNDLQLQLADDALGQQMFGFDANQRHGVWRQRILTERDHGRIPNGECDQYGDWLRGDAVQNIIDYERRPADDRPRLLINQNTPITVIEDARMIGNPVIDPTQAARAALANPGVYTHGFVFNTARTAIDRHGMPYVPRGGGRGHWLAAVMHRNAQGAVQWFVANSYDQHSILHSPTLRDLIAAVQGAQV